MHQTLWLPLGHDKLLSPSFAHASGAKVKRGMHQQPPASTAAFCRSHSAVEGPQEEKDIDHAPDRLAAPCPGGMCKHKQLDHAPPGDIMMVITSHQRFPLQEPPRLWKDPKKKGEVIMHRTIWLPLVQEDCASPEPRTPGAHTPGTHTPSTRPRISAQDFQNQVQKVYLLLAV